MVWKRSGYTGYLQFFKTWFVILSNMVLLITINLLHLCVYNPVMCYTGGPSGGDFSRSLPGYPADIQGPDKVAGFLLRWHDCCIKTCHRWIRWLNAEGGSDGITWTLNPCSRVRLPDSPPSGLISGTFLTRTGLNPDGPALKRAWAMIKIFLQIIFTF